MSNEDKVNETHQKIGEAVDGLILDSLARIGNAVVDAVGREDRKKRVERLSKPRKPDKPANRCKKCDYRIRSPNHEDGSHHKAAMSGKRRPRRGGKK